MPTQTGEKVMKPTGIFKTVIALLALVAVTLTLGVAIKVGAEELQEQENTVAIKMRNYTEYQFYPDGYKVGYGDKVEFSGTYVLTGNPEEDIYFRSNGTPVTYNVIFHSLNAVSDLWYGMISLDPYVTLNVTVYGDNSVIAYNHPGFSSSGSGEGAPTVNITMTENSRLVVGCNYSETNKVFSDGIDVYINEEATSSVDMSVDGWKNNMEIVFTNGTEYGHEMGYVYVDDDVCRYQCAECDLASIESEHEIYSINYEEDHADYAAKHSRKCILCQYEFDVEEHEIWYVQEENYHIEVCRGCYYEGEMQEHVMDGDSCEVCGLAYAFKHEADGEETYIFTTDKAIELLREKGGKLTVLNDVEELFGKMIDVSSADVTIDLAGNKLIGVSASVASGKALTVIDSSADKSGVWEKSSSGSNLVYGSLLIDGITAVKMYVIAYDGSTVAVNNLVCTESFFASINNGSIIEITNSTFEKSFEINFSVWSYELNLELSECTFGEIKVSSSFGEDVYVNMLLGEGYAFAGEEGLIDGSGASASNATAIVEHTEHNADKIQTNNAEHWVSCTCGNGDGAFRSPHTLGENGRCPICDVLIVATLTVGEETTYYASVVDALEAPTDGDVATVTLLANFNPNDYKEVKVRGSITLDLNGYTYNVGGRLRVYKELIINDSSEGKTGKLCEDGDLSYIIEFYRDSKVVINDGEFFGLIYGALYGSETATITINGGRFLGEEKFRLNPGTHVIVNGGVFECSESVFSFTWSSRVTYEINGGVFINSTVFESSEEYRPESLESVLGTGIECELAFISAKGEALTLEDLCDYYEGEIYVFHKNSDTAYNDVIHKLYCYDCKEYSTEINHTKVYTLSTSDGGVHDVSCRVCDMSICSENHIGGVATCTDKAECERCLTPYGDEPQGHIYDNACDTECNVCNDEREVPDHVYDNACDTECNECELEREVPDHVYDNACDTDCNECELEREVPDHVYDNACDTECNECEYPREITHVYGADGSCTVCGAADPNAPTTDSSTAESNEPTTDSSTVESNEPTTDSSTVESNEPTTDSSTADSGEPTTDSSTVESNEPTTDSSTVESNEPTTDSSTVESNEQTTDSSTVESNEPTTDSSTVESSGAPTTGTTASSTPENLENTADEGLSTGAIIGIVLGSVAAVGAAGAVTFIIIRKKKFTNI